MSKKSGQNRAYAEINEFQKLRRNNVAKFVVAAIALFLMTFFEWELISTAGEANSSLIEMAYLTISLLVMMFMAKQAIDHTKRGMRIESIEKQFGVTRQEAKLYRK